MIVIGLVIWKKYRLSQAEKKNGTSAKSVQNTVFQREREIIELVIRGKTNEEIADGLFISIKTEKYHLYNVFQKMGVKNRLQLINFIRSKPFEKK